MYEYRIVDNSAENPSINEGKASLEKLEEILPHEIYEMLLTPGTISIKELSSHITYEIQKSK